MALLAYFDSTQPAPQPVLAWYDTGVIAYPALPASANLLQLTPTQWASRMTGLWAVQGGALVASTAPAPTLAEDAMAAIGAGLMIALSGSVTLSATIFPTDPVTQAKLAAVVTTLTATGEFPGGAATYPLKSASGEWYTFTVNQYKAVAGAIASYVAALDLIIDGNPLSATALPASSVSLAV
jgi:hypothetical protein